MISNAQHRVLYISQEQIIVIGIGAVPGIGEPEILPYQNAVTVAGFVEFVVADLPYPISNHVEIHLAVVTQGAVIFASTVAQHRLAKSPIAAASDKAPAVDEDSQRTVVLTVGHLADSGFQRLGVGYLPILEFKFQFHVIQMRISVADRPPQLRILQMKRGMYR